MNTSRVREHRTRRHDMHRMGLRTCSLTPPNRQSNGTFCRVGRAERASVVMAFAGADRMIDVYIRNNRRLLYKAKGLAPTILTGKVSYAVCKSTACGVRLVGRGTMPARPFHSRGRLLSDFAYHLHTLSSALHCHSSAFFRRACAPCRQSFVQDLHLCALQHPATPPARGAHVWP